ncbi:MAG TPA: hypothetical protein VGV85_03755 [Longimicrobiaceae bacterium]|jgi:hypothetical protein|nr:hypothetical protein [Longimicrobiaceae bacterium]
MGEVFFVMMVPITGILTAGTVMLLRPITKELGGLLQAMTQERKLRVAPAPATPDMTQVRDLLVAIDSRLSLMEERQDFAEALLSGAERRVIAAPAARAAGQN